MSDQQKKQELPPIPKKERSMPWLDYWREVALPERERQLLAALSDNEALRVNPKVADCFICGASIFASNERITEDGRTYHPICALRADNEPKDARIAELERLAAYADTLYRGQAERDGARIAELTAEGLDLKGQIAGLRGAWKFEWNRAEAAEAKLKSVERLLEEYEKEHWLPERLSKVFARIREAIK